MPTAPKTPDQWVDPPGWRPKENDSIDGIVQSIDVATSEYGSYPVVVIKPDDGDAVAVHGFHSILRDKLLALRPAVGERLMIVRGPERKVKNSSNSYVLYRVECPDRPADASGWDVFGTTPVAPPAPDFAPGGPADNDDVPFD